MLLLHVHNQPLAAVDRGGRPPLPRHRQWARRVRLWAQKRGFAKFMNECDTWMEDEKNIAQLYNALMQ